jgi:hypothetical protein
MIGGLAIYLPHGAPFERIAAALGTTAGQKFAFEQFSRLESILALTVNGVGPFLNVSFSLPPFPCLPNVDWLALSIDIERQVRLHWSRGRYP